MNKLGWSPIAAKRRASQAGVLPPGALAVCFADCATSTSLRFFMNNPG